MSILLDCEYQDITEFTGPNLLLDEEDVTEPQGLSCRNVEYVEGQVRIPRRGFTQVWNPNKVLRVLYNWVQQQSNRLIYLNSDNNVISRDLSSGTETTLLSSITAAGMTFAQAGYRIYLAFFNSDGTSSDYCKVWDGTAPSGVPQVENAFQPTLTTADLSGGASWGTFSEPGAGSVTVGEHQFAIVPTTYNGFQTSPGPTLLGVFSPRAFTAAGSKSIELHVSPASTWPLWVNTLQVAMTTVENPNRWFLVPDAIWFVTRGGSGTALFEIDIDDVTLTGGGPTEITDTLFNLYTTPTAVQCIIAYNNRNVYLTRTLGPDFSSLVGTILVSEPFQPQYVTGAEHLLNLPEFRDCLTGFALGSTLYICGPSWTYAFTDNLRVPVLWSPPRRVSGSVGSPFIKGVSANDAKGYAWVADRTGLYFFDGSVFPIIPASYEQGPDWDRINFGAGQNILRVLDSPDDRLIMVRAPLDGATTSTHILVWDYTDGVTARKIKYCGLWNITAWGAIGDFEIVQAATSKVKQLWMSRGDANGDVKRLKSIKDGDATATNPTALYNDSAAGIDGAYRLLAVARAADGVMQQVGVGLRVRGAGQINVEAYSFDQVRHTSLSPITSGDNSLAPGKRHLRLLDEQSEAVSYELNNGAAAGCFAWWSAVRAYFTAWMKER